VNSPLEIQLGLPGEDNAALPGFVIKPGGLGDGSSTYSGTRIVVNNGAYLDIDSDQKLDTLTSAMPTAGKFKVGNVTVKSGGKLRDGAYSDWPLGDGSTFAIEAGGYLAVGPGDRSGQYIQRVSNAVSNDPFASGFDGWLIGPSGDINSRIQLGGTDYASSQIWVAKGWVYLYDGSYAKVASYANIYPYNVLVGQGSIVEIAAELETSEDTTQAKFYGSPAAVSSATPEPATFQGGTVKITGSGTVSGVALGLSGSSDITSGTYFCSSGGSSGAVGTTPWTSANNFVCNWAVATSSLSGSGPSVAN
jgi:hypothetical protein